MNDWPPYTKRKSGQKTLKRTHFYRKYIYADLVAPFYGVSKESFIKFFYLYKKMSDIEIAEMIEKDTGHKFPRQAIFNWRKSVGIKARSPHEAFQLAVDKKRFNHSKVALKINYKQRVIDYKKREIDYNDIASKLKPSEKRYYADNLGKIINKKRIDKIEFALKIGFSPFTLMRWIRKQSKVSKVEICRMAEILKVEPFEICPEMFPSIPIQ